MHSIRDQFRIDILEIHGGPSGSRLPMMQSQHSVKRMRKAVRPILNRSGTFIKFSPGMSHGHFHALRNTVADQRMIIIFFRCDADHLDFAVRCFLITLELFNIRFLN